MSSKFNLAASFNPQEMIDALKEADQPSPVTVGRSEDGRKCVGFSLIQDNGEPISYEEYCARSAEMFNVIDGGAL